MAKSWSFNIFSQNGVTRVLTEQSFAGGLEWKTRHAKTFNLNLSIGERSGFCRTSIHLFWNIFLFKHVQEKITYKSFQITYFLINNFEKFFIVLRYGFTSCMHTEECFIDWFNSSWLFQLYHLCKFVTFFQSKLWEEY